VERAQLLEALAGAIQELPERDQLIISLYYVEELNLKEIGEILGVSESRVSQLLTAIAKKLRSLLQPAVHGSTPT
jgi:RNA polymerase sigma factor for flagellar operon FliA